ncbi:polysaccharide biosynthesis/export protein [Synechococcus sp. SYN20]|uniref:polysaccharide biosynthesis/export family protein n=1 Tax=Synechococcus sp. SYN20 TaxID=1050714 RepID=UPI001647ABC9|nr:polysaccharide biosynthesis/export family protein [Synechococcus sp. SYN20]QNJ24554.1 polysaccharide biosynthesis/export protein [Synechococcus sp. SYN20]
MVRHQRLRSQALLGLCLLVSNGYFTAGAFEAVPSERAQGTASLALVEEVQDVYIIGPGDVLQLNLFDAPELSGELEVLNDGSVPLPLVGSIVLSGLTLQQASLWARELLADQLLRPELQLKVIRPRPIRVSVVGAVERPGLYSLTTTEAAQVEGGPSTSLTGLPTLVDAIQKAGGITQKANLRNVQLQRRLPGTPARFKRARLNLLDLVLEGDQLQNPFLFDGDTIKLERAEETPQEAIELASANLSPQVITVNVIGEVNSPGRIETEANTPLVQAILIAGGLKSWRANGGQVELVRINRNGTATLKRFRFDMSQGASNETNPPLRQGDTIRVGRSMLAKGSDAIGAVSEPLSGLVTIGSLFRLLND